MTKLGVHVPVPFVKRFKEFGATKLFGRSTNEWVVETLSRAMDAYKE